MSVKALLNHVLEEVAIDGEEGTTIQQLFQYVNDFYLKNRQPRYDIINLDKNKSATETTETTETENKEPEEKEWGLPNVQEDFQEYVWSLLKQQRGFSVGKDNFAAGHTLKEIVDKLRAGEYNEDDLKVYADEERRWIALTGHGINHQLVPKALYKCLEVIAKFREEGLIQPELTMLTKQDKRSIATRTSLLKEAGYIEKVGVLAKKVSTSKLTLKRFAVQRDLRQMKKEQKGPLKELWTGKLIQTEQLTNSIIAELKASKSKVLLRSELKVKMSMDQSKFHTRAFSRLLARVETLGVWKRIRVPLKIKSTRIDENGDVVPAVVNGREHCTYARCIRFIRDPNEEDWRKLLSAARLEIQVDSDDEEGSGDENENAADNAAAANELAGTDAVEEVSREVPRWNPMVPIPNTLFDLVEASGMEGLASMDAIGKAIGTFYYRPMDQILHRLTDFPCRSQPPQYLNYSIIRETSITQRQTHYRYFAYRHHQELCRRGLAVQPWVVTNKKGSKPKSENKNPVKPDMPEVDEFGFMPFDTSRLIKADGSATLAEAQRRGQRGEKIEKLNKQFYIIKKEDGTEAVSFGNRKPNTPGGAKPKYTGPPRPRGRPRADGTTGPPRPRGKGAAAKRRAMEAMLSDHELPPPKKLGRPPKGGNDGPAKPRRRGPGKATLAAEAAARAEAAAKKAAAEQLAANAPAQDVAMNDAAPVSTPVEAAQEQVMVETAPQGTAQMEAPPTPLRAATATPAPPADHPSTPAPALETPGRATPVPDTPVRATPIPGTPSNKRIAFGTPGSGTATKRRKQTTLDFFLKTPRGAIPSAQSSPQRTPSRRPKEKAIVIDEGVMEVDTPVPEERPVTETPVPETETEVEVDIPEAPIKQKRVAELDDEAAPLPLPAEQPEPVTVQDAEQPPDVMEIDNMDAPVDTQGYDAIPVVGEQAEPKAEETGGDGPEHVPVSQEEQPKEEDEGPAPAVSVDGHEVQVERVNPDQKESYNSIGGMLALGRQQAIMDLLNKHDGLFPGGLEIRHAYNKIYMERNKKAGMADRRLVRGVIESLQMKGKVNVLVFTFMSSRGLPTERKIVIRSDISLDDPKVSEMTRNIIAADGALWFPPNTELPPDIEKRLATNNFLGPNGGKVVKGVSFDRLYPSAVDAMKKTRSDERTRRSTASDEKKLIAKEKKLERERRKADKINAHWSRKFTELQRMEAKARKKELRKQERAEKKAQKALLKLNTKYSAKDVNEDGKVPGDCAPKSVWWNDYVDRNQTNFVEEVENVKQLELALVEAGNEQEIVDMQASEFPMVNHFLPPQDLPENFMPKVPKNLENQNPPQRTFSKRVVRHTCELPPDYVQQDPPPVERKIRRRRARALVDPDAPVKKKRTRRAAAMEQIHNNALDKADDGKDEIVIKATTHRNIYVIPKDDEDTLLVAVIIYRALFGERDRRIDWSIVQRALPQHPPNVLRGRWPRVRDTQRAHLKRLQIEFEEMYLEAYDRGLLPKVDTRRPDDFDLIFHVEWFKENLELPEADTISELPNSREVFDRIYSLKPEKVFIWRGDFHNPVASAGNRANNFLCFPYQAPRFPPPQTDPKQLTPVEFAKSVIKSNIMTEESKYNSTHAFDLLRSLPEEAVDEAFYDLNFNKVIAHKKEHNRAAPGRNYELTEKFHLSLRTVMDEKLFAQAVSFNRNIATQVAAKQPIIISPFMTDGTVACLLDLLVRNHIRLRKRDYKTREMGLIKGYETRAMPKHLVDFEVVVDPLPKYFEKRELPALPPIPPIEREDDKEPMRLWMDINRNIISGMWLRCCTAVLSTVTGRSGATVDGIVKVLEPGITRLEVRDVLEWLRMRGAVKSVGVEGAEGWMAEEDYYLALEGL